ncbi:MAG: hypothetical protein ACI9K2_003965 [Myxococcota bacterium]|jgi:hypothetical protein
MRMRLALLLAAALTGCPSAPAPSLELSTVVPGLTVSLPTWAARETPGVPGNVTLTPPSGNSRFIELRWRSGVVATPEQVTAQWEGQLGVPADHLPDAVVGTQVDTLYLETPGKRVAFTRWPCPNGLTYSLTTFAELDRETMLALHRSILASAACEAVPVPAPTFPGFTPPQGFTAAGVEGERTFTGPGGEILSIGPGQPGAEFAALLLTPAGRQSLLPTLGLAQLDPPEEVSLPGPDGTARPLQVMQGRGVNGVAVQLVLTAFTCPDLDLSFYGMHRSAPEVKPRLEALAGMSCPPPRTR